MVNKSWIKLNKNYCTSIDSSKSFCVPFLFIFAQCRDEIFIKVNKEDREKCMATADCFISCH